MEIKREKKMDDEDDDMQGDVETIINEGGEQIEVEQSLVIAEGEYDERIQELEKLMDLVDKGTHPDLTKECQVFSKVRSRRIKAAQMHQKLQLQNVEALYDFEIRAAEQVYQTSVLKLKEQLVSSVQTRLDTARRELESLDKQTEKTSSCEAEEVFEPVSIVGNADIADNIEKYRAALVETWKHEKEALSVQPVLTKGLTPEEAINDLRIIHNDWKMAAQRIKEFGAQKVTYEKGRITCAENILEVGDDVVVTSRFIEEAYYGTLSALDEEAVYIMLEDGTKARVYLSHLKNSRCTIFPRPYTGRSNEPNSWVDDGSGET